MKLLELYFRGSSYGYVVTDANPTGQGGEIIRIEQSGLPDLAQLAADVLGDDQPLLPSYGSANLAKWIIRYGVYRWGERPFLQAMSWSLIWRRGQRFSFEVLCER